MSNIDRVGSFRGKIVDRAIGQSSGGYPQAILQLEAAEMWDSDNGVWVPWNYDERETVAYLVMFGRSGKPTASARQLMKALGWDGVAFIDIQENTELKDQIQWRMEENTWEGNTTIRCQWIDEYDAVPGRKVQKLDKSDIAVLQAKFAGGLQQLSGGPKPKSAPPAAPPQAPAPAAASAPESEPPFEPDPTPPAGTAPGTDAPQDSAATGAETTSAPEPTAPPAAPGPPKEEKPKRTRKPKAIDMNTAWTKCFEAGKAKGKTDVEITQIWTGIVTEAGGNDAVGTDWNPVKAKFEEAIAS